MHDNTSDQSPPIPAEPAATPALPGRPMTDAGDDTLIGLPHSGLRIPHNRLSVTGYRELVNVCGIAFTANLRLDTVAVGVVFNEGTGGATGYHPHAQSVFTGRELSEFAAACRTTGGHRPDVEAVLDSLVYESRTARRVNRHTRRDETPLRLVTPLLDDEVDIVEVGQATAGRITTDAAVRRLAVELAESDPPEPGEWWQWWNGDTWINVEPAVVPDGADRRRDGRMP